MAAAADRLSALPDDVLEHILSFAPAKGGASTAVLSRRWRLVWRRAGSVSLDSNLYAAAAARTSSSSEPFLRDAVKLLDAFRRGGTELKRLTLFLDTSAYHGARRDSFTDEKEKQREAEDRVSSVVLAHPSAAQLEELRVHCRSRDYRYRPWLPTLPCAATLRVLDLSRCELYPPPSAAPPDLPCLTDLRLHVCIIAEGYLQVVVDAAPALASLVMAYVSHNHKPAENLDRRRRYLSLMDGFSVRFRLCCPTVIALELEVRPCEEELETWANPGIELDMPSLRSLRYNGPPVKLSLTSPAPALERVDIDVSRRDHDVPQYEPTSRMLASFSSTRALKLRLPCIEDIVAGEDILPPTFPNLEILELNGHYNEYKRSDTAVAMARLLRSCPAMSELRLLFEMETGWNYERNGTDPFAQSMERFNTLSPMSSTHRDMVRLGGVSDLPDAMTSNCAFSCLQKSLRKVTLKFAAKEVNCFQVQLAKFIVENAMVLEEMHVDDGAQFCPDHLCNKLAAWRADSFRRRNLPGTGQEDPEKKPPHRVKVYLATHRKKDKDKNKHVADLEELVKLIDEQPELAQNNRGKVAWKGDALHTILGEEKSGQVHGMGLLPVPNQVYGRRPRYLKNINMSTTNGSSHDEETDIMEAMAKLTRRIEEQDRRIEEQDQIIEAFKYKDEENFHMRGNGVSQSEVPRNKRKRVHASGPDPVRSTRPGDVIMNNDLLDQHGMHDDNDMLLSNKQKHHPEYEGSNDFSHKGQSSPTPPISHDGREIRNSGEKMDENSRRSHKHITQKKTTDHVSSKGRCGPLLEIGTTLILKSSTYPNKRRVAYATVLGSNSKLLVGGVELGRQFTEVKVDEPIEEDESLVRERENCLTIGDAFASGVAIAWPSACIEKIKG